MIYHSTYKSQKAFSFPLNGAALKCLFSSLMITIFHFLFFMGWYLSGRAFFKCCRPEVCRTWSSVIISRNSQTQLRRSNNIPSMVGKVELIGKMTFPGWSELRASSSLSFSKESTEQLVFLASTTTRFILVSSGAWMGMLSYLPPHLCRAVRANSLNSFPALVLNIGVCRNICSISRAFIIFSSAALSKSRPLI